MCVVLVLIAWGIVILSGVMTRRHLNLLDQEFSAQIDLTNALRRENDALERQLQAQQQLLDEREKLIDALMGNKKRDDGDGI